MSTTPQSPGSTPLPPDAIDALRRGHKIEAVRLMRQHSGLGLKESKDAVDAYERLNPPDHAYLHAKPGDPSPGEVRGGASGLWWIVAALVALLGYYLLRG